MTEMTYEELDYDVQIALDRLNEDFGNVFEEFEIAVCINGNDYYVFVNNEAMDYFCDERDLTQWLVNFHTFLDGYCTALFHPNLLFIPKRLAV